LPDSCAVLLSEHRSQGSSHHLLLGLWHRLQKVPGEMNAQRCQQLP